MSGVTPIRTAVSAIRDLLVAAHLEVSQGVQSEISLREALKQAVTLTADTIDFLDTERVVVWRFLFDGVMGVKRQVDAVLPAVEEMQLSEWYSKNYMYGHPHTALTITYEMISMCPVLKQVIEAVYKNEVLPARAVPPDCIDYIREIRTVAIR